MPRVGVLPATRNVPEGGLLAIAGPVALLSLPGFDHDHDLLPSDRQPHEIMYAFLVDLKHRPYLVSVGDGRGGASFQALDLTDRLSEHDGVIVYDPSKLYRAAPNEYWFLCDPLEAAQLLFTLYDQHEDLEGDGEEATRSLHGSRHVGLDRPDE